MTSLTPSEKIVLTLAKDGLTRTEIHERLFKTENTLKSQISSILKKLDVGNLNDAIRVIKRRGIRNNK